MHILCSLSWEIWRIFIIFIMGQFNLAAYPLFWRLNRPFFSGLSRQPVKPPKVDPSKNWRLIRSPLYENQKYRVFGIRMVGEQITREQPVSYGSPMCSFAFCGWYISPFFTAFFRSSVFLSLVFPHKQHGTRKFVFSLFWPFFTICLLEFNKHLLLTLDYIFRCTFK